MRVTVDGVDEPPEIGGTASFTISEAASKFVGSYGATDPEGTDVSWEALAGPDARYFAFDELSGALSFKDTPDYDRSTNGNHGDTYRVTARASDEGNKVGNLPVTVTLIGVDEPPIISGPATIDVNEVIEPTPGQVVRVGDYTRRDPEGSSSNWGMVGSTAALTGADASRFEFDKPSGRLTFVDPPDFEGGGGRYQVTLNANDGSLDGRLDVTVNVANLDEPGAVPLGAQRGVINVPLTATLTDADTIMSETWQWQRSTSRTGAGTDIANADSNRYTPTADDRNYYLRATVEYEDGHGPGKNAHATTEFTTANECTSNTAPVFPDPVDGISIPENIGPGGNVGPVRASDGENDPLVYTLSGVPEFVIGRTTGQIQVAPGVTFDYEGGRSSYAALVTADDGCGGTDTVGVTINITDAPEPPVALDDAPPRFDEDTSIEIDVLANDSDPEDDRSDLTVNVVTGSAEGSATVNAPRNPGDWPTIAYTPRANYSGSDSFTYRVRDTSGRLSNVATAALTIRAVNDAPAFPGATAERSVSEKAQAGDSVGAPVTATDVDGDTLSYSLSGSFDFEIEEHTARITVRDGAVLDSANQPTHTVIVTAEDGRGGRASTGVTITVTAGPVIIITGGGGGGGGGGPTPSELDFEWNVTRDIEELDGGNDWPTGLWSDGETLWIADNADGAGDTVYAYDRESGERVEEREFALHETNRAPRGFWSDRSVVWVSDSGRERLFAYDLATGERLEDREFVLAERNSDARGIWSDEETMWVLDGRAGALFAYDFESGELLAEYELDAANDDPHGIWSDGVTIWVSDHGAKRLIAYRLPAPERPAAEDAEPQDLERVRDEEFPNTVLSRAGNNSPRGLWSDGDVMYVADESDDRIYTYNMPDAIDARLALLTLSSVDIGEFDPRRPDYEAVVADGVTETTVEAAAMQRRTDVVIDPPDADGDDANGHQVALRDLGEITVTVTSRDGSRERVYRVLLGPEEAVGPTAEEATGTAPEEAAGPAPKCLRGAVAVGFSLVVYEGGSIEELVTCAESRDMVTLYVLHEGVYASYILGAPSFVNAGFVELFPDGLPSITPLIAGSNGPPSADPSGDLDDGGQPWPECLRGDIAAGFSLVVYEGGSVDELEACARTVDITALYTLSEGEFVSYILGAPGFVNQSFRDLFTDGLPLMTLLVAKSEGHGDR